MANKKTNKFQSAIDQVVKAQENKLARGKKFKKLMVLHSRTSELLEEVSAELRGYIKDPNNFVVKKGSKKEETRYIFTEDKPLDLYYPHEAQRLPEVVLTSQVVTDQKGSFRKLTINEDYLRLQKKLIEAYAENSDNSERLMDASIRKQRLETVADFYGQVLKLKEEKATYEKQLQAVKAAAIKSSFRGLLKTNREPALKAASAIKAGQALSSRFYKNTAEVQTTEIIKKIAEKELV